ncbi:unnamed protein product [Schistosoma curassoni]|uniref:Ash family protein n=1 Tax=Schistosoma curassoni TaxID=6186 RepID=A0A183KNR3_9TREM|nr:unnamed protein product [Schistosoma curassoni]
MPPNMSTRVFSASIPKAAHPGGISPCTAGRNHWQVAKANGRK